MSKTQQTAGEKPRIGEQEVRRAAELLKKYRQGKVNLERRIIDNEQFWKLRHWPQMEKEGGGGKSWRPAAHQRLAGELHPLQARRRHGLLPGAYGAAPENRGTGRRRPS